MYAERLLRRLGRMADRFWPIRAMGRWVYEREFAANRGHNLFRGVFADFDEAKASAPATRPLGYDNQASSDLYPDHLRLQDYAALFWLRRAFEAGARRVFDLGGHTGMKFYAFRRLEALPEDVHWTVCDVPAVVDAGRRRAVRDGVERQLAFTTDRDALAGADVLYSSGAFQYLDESPGALLGRIGVRPKWLLLNGLPLHRQRDFVTLNAIGTAFCPYRVQSRPGLIAELEALGYRKIDEWENEAKPLDLPFHPELRVHAYAGFCFERIDAAAQAPVS